MRDAYDRKLLSFDDFKVEVNLINTGIFSILEEDKGLHHIPQYCINEFEKPSGADLVFTVMHHSPDWYTDDQKNILEREIYNKSSLVFFGHEHYPGSKALSFSPNQQALIQAGGRLCNNEDWTDSAFHVGVLDTVNLEYVHRKFVWDNTAKQYEDEDVRTESLAKKPSVEKSLMPTDEFMSNFLTDPKSSISNDFREYFVFPRLQSEDGIKVKQKEFVSEESFFAEIVSRKRVIICGLDDFGKTTLLKHLFFAFANSDYVPLYCDIDNIKGKHPDRIIKTCFEDIYGENPSDYIRYTQIPKERKVVIIDDIDQIDHKSIDHFFKYLESCFELCVFSSHDTIDLNILDRMKAQLNAGDSIPKYQIEPMYSDKRMELIANIVRIKVPDTSSQKITVDALVAGISSQRQFFNLNPGFIIKYVVYYINIIGETVYRDSNIFSKVFEANLTNAIVSNNNTKLSTDKVFILLSKVAAFIHFNKSYPIDERDIGSVIKKYNSEYDDTVYTNDFLNIAISSRIMAKDDAKNGYLFMNKSYLAYFVAKEVNREYHDTLDETRLNYLLQNACFGINADILLFISYITDNIRILRLLLHTIHNATDAWDEFDFEKEKLPPFLNGAVSFTIEAPNDKTREREKQAEIDSEKKSNELVQTKDIYDYSEEDADKLINQFIRAVQLLSIAARCLPNFEHMMRKEDKDQFVEVIYSLPNKIFNIWAMETNKNIEEIFAFFKQQSQDYFSRKKPISDDELRFILQWSAMSILLDLYNIAVLYSTKETTMPLLSKSHHLKKRNGRIEHLMMMERQSTAGFFLNEAEELDRQSLTPVEKTTIKRIVEHALVMKDGFSSADLDRAKNKFFPNMQQQRQLMAKRFIQKGKKDE